MCCFFPFLTTIIEEELLGSSDDAFRATSSDNLTLRLTEDDSFIGIEKALLTKVFTFRNLLTSKFASDHNAFIEAFCVALFLQCLQFLFVVLIFNTNFFT